MPHTIDAVSQPEKPIRNCLLHNKMLHTLLFSLLMIDGLICLTSGVLETQFLHSASDDCVAYVDKCVPIQAHRRLAGETWQDALDPFTDRLPWPRFLSTNTSSHNPSGTGGHGSTVGIGSTGGHGSATGLGSTGGHGSTAAHGIPGCGHVGQTDHFGNHDLHTAELYLAYISMGILVSFFIEQCALIIELGSEYCKPMFVLDFVVITSSFALEIFVVTNSSNLSSSSGLLVLARTWRFARVGHGMIASQEEIEVVTEEDESFTALAELWGKVDDERWIEIAKKMTREDFLKTVVNQVEKEIVEEIQKNEHVIMRSLALSRMYQLHCEKKAAQRKGTSMQMSEALGKAGTARTV